MAKDVVIKLIGDTKDFQKNLDATTKSLGDWSKGMTDVGKKAGIAFAGVAAAMGVVGGRALKLAGELEQQKVAFKALLGSAEAADKVISRIQKEAARTPFEFSGLSAMTQQLATITKDGDKAVDILMSVGDAIATSGKDIGEMQRVVLNLQQVAATGKVTAMDIRQFQGAVPIFNDILKASGLTTKKLQESENAAQLLFGAFAKASKEGGLTFGGLINQSTTFNGLVSTLKDNFDATFRQIGEVLLPDAKKLAIVLSNIANKVAEFAKEYPGLIKIVTVFSLIVAGVLALVSAIGFIGGAVANGIKTIKLLTNAVKAFDLISKAAFLTNPIFLWIAGIAALIAITVLVIKNWDKVKKFFVGIFNYIKTNFTKIATILFKAFTNPIGLIIEKWGAIVKFFKGIGKSIVGFIKGDKAAPSTDGGKTPNKTPTPSSAPAAIGGLMATSGFSTEGLDKFRESLTMTADEALTKFAEIGQGFTDSVVTGILDGTLSMDAIFQEFILKTETAILTQLFAPITEGMSMMSSGLVEIFNNTFGLLLSPITMFVGNMIKSFATSFLTIAGLQKTFAAAWNIGVMVMGFTWKLFTTSMVLDFVVAMGAVLLSIIGTVISAIWAFALMAASAAAAAVALIPIIGPVLAPIAYIATFGLVIGGIAKISGLADGSAGLEEDGLHQFSKGEMVVPETFASGIKSGELTLGAGGNSSNSAPINVSLDGAHFNGTFDSEMAMGIGNQISLAIKNNVMAPMPA